MHSGNVGVSWSGSGVEVLLLELEVPDVERCDCESAVCILHAGQSQSLRLIWLIGYERTQ